jgi:uncharacterized protein (TIGR00290 family)
MPEPILLSWSGGKDSAFALHTLRSSPDFEPVGLLTTITEDYDRISIHGVRRELLERQAEAIGLPLHQVLIPKDCPNEVYEDRLAAALRPIKDQGIRHVAFGDLYLEDIRAYREKQMAALGLEPVFPVWGRDTTELAHEIIHLGFRAVLVCVDTDVLDPVFAGRSFDEDLLRDLPPTSISAARTASSTPSSTPGRSSASRWRSGWDGWRGGGGSGFGIWSPRRVYIRVWRR